MCEVGSEYVCEIWSEYACEIVSEYVCEIGSGYVCEIGSEYVCEIGSEYVRYLLDTSSLYSFYLSSNPQSTLKPPSMYRKVATVLADAKGRCCV